MATDFIERTIPHVAGGSSEESDPHESANPISHRNLLVITKLSKGKFPVYKMLSQANRQHYVMKVFDNNIPDSHAFYKNELRFCSMNHPNVVKIVGSGKVKTVSQHDLSTHVTYVLSEYAPHGDFLDLVINHRKELDEKLTRTYFRQLIEGLEYLHSKGIAHLDLKPENLLIAEDFSLKITDFDLSYVNGDREIIGCGTVLYRAPEFYNAKTDIQLESPYACDIYSAGIILFLLKSGGVYPHLEHEIIKGTDFDLTKLLERESSRFWTKHVEMQGKCKDVFNSDFKSLFSKMMKTNPKKRPSIKKIKESKWYNGPVYTPQELQEKMRSVLGL